MDDGEMKGIDPPAPPSEPALWSGRWWGAVRSGPITLLAPGQASQRRRPRSSTPAYLEPVLTGLRDLSQRVDAANRDFVGRSAQFEAALAQLRGEQEQTALRVRDARSPPGEGHNGEAHAILREEMQEAMRRLEARLGDAEARAAAGASRLAEALEQRVHRSEQARTETLVKLGDQIGRLAERLSDRIGAVERQAAAAPEPDALSELADRRRRSEARTLQLLTDARETLQRREAAQGAPDQALLAAPVRAAAAPAVPFRRGMTPSKPRGLTVAWLAAGGAAACMVLVLAAWGALHARTAPAYPATAKPLPLRARAPT